MISPFVLLTPTVPLLGFVAIWTFVTSRLFSTSLSLLRTLIITDLFLSVVALSLFATGDVLTGVSLTELTVIFTVAEFEVNP